MGKGAAAPAEKVALYEKLLATNPRVEQKGDAMPYTSVNGHMFSLLTRTGTRALRLPEEERHAFLKKYKSKLTEQYGVVMKEYVDVPDSLLQKTSELQKYFAASYKYVSSVAAEASATSTMPQYTTDPISTQCKTDPVLFLKAPGSSYAIAKTYGMNCALGSLVTSSAVAP